MHPISSLLIGLALMVAGTTGKPLWTSAKGITDFANSTTSARIHHPTSLHSDLPVTTPSSTKNIGGHQAANGTTTVPFSATNSTNSTAASGIASAVTSFPFPTAASNFSLGSNYTCDQLDALDPSTKWNGVQGDAVLQNVINFFENDLIICPACFGQLSCSSSDPLCQKGLRSLTLVDGAPEPRFDAAVGLCSSLDPGLGSLNCDINHGGCEGYLPCHDNNVAIFLILESLSALSTYYQAIYTALTDAQLDLTDQMSSFSNDFAPLPPSDDDGFESVLGAILSGVVGFIPGVGAAIGGAVAGIGTAVIGYVQGSGAPQQPTDTSQWLGAIATGIQQGYANVSHGVFQDASYASNGQNVHLADLAKNGALLEAMDNGTMTTDMTSAYGQQLFETLALYTWNNLPAKDVTHMPFLTFDSQPCETLDKSQSVFGSAITSEFFNIDAAVSLDGACWYLLDALPIFSVQSTPHGHDSDPTDTTTEYCNVVNALPGGTVKGLNSVGSKYFGVQLSDIIVLILNEHLTNGLANKDPSTSQAAVPVCDYSKNMSNGGKYCPLLTGNTTASPGQFPNSCVRT